MKKKYSYNVIVSDERDLDNEYYSYNSINGTTMKKNANRKRKNFKNLNIGLSDRKCKQYII